MLITSVAIPFAAVAHRVRGELGARLSTHRRTAAVLFDRDGTLIKDAQSLRDPAGVEPITGAQEAVARLRAAGIPVGVVSNQALVGEGTLTERELGAINARVDALVGPFAVWRCCTHSRVASCACRKPAPGLVREAARALGVDPADCVVIGDIGADVEAAVAAGARPILVPNGVTREQEITAAPVVAGDLGSAVDLVLAGRV
ncbi:MAG: HAD-IIIA family hydrolase [Candidatus Eremiobacteraeota bacterium]|nr:HAD-IIIA family hydrolase [Candidatus Eremiobacteraeota bacterium]